MPAIKLQKNRCHAGSILASSFLATTTFYNASAYAAWQPPIGIPAPSFGINEVAPAYNQANALHYYVNNAVGCGDSNNSGRGSPTAPRCTVPASLAAGSLVEIGGGTYSYSGTIRIGGNGTAAQPVFVRGSTGTAKPRFNRPMELSGSYVVVENIDLDNWSQSNDVGFDFNGDHLVLRNSEVHNGPKATTTSVVPGNSTNVVIYSNKIHDNGDWQATVDQDHHGIGGFGGSYVWILDNELYHQSGDGVQINSKTAHHIYVGRNNAWQNKQTGFWIKYGQDVIFSQNVSHDHAGSDSSPGGGMGWQYGPDRVWFLFNRLYNNQYGFAPGSTDSGSPRIYIVGNLIHNNVHNGMRIYNNAAVHIINNTVFGSPGSSSDPGGINVFNGSNYIANNLVDGGIQETDYIAELRNNFYVNAAAPASNGNISGNPLFVNVTNNNPLLRDFHVQSSSAAIDKGTSAGIVQTVY